MRTHCPISAALLLSCLACGSVDPGAEGEVDVFDLQELDEYRSAIPAPERLEVTTGGVTPERMGLTERGDAELAALAIDSAVKVNSPARAMVGLLRAIVKLSPTRHDVEERKFVWGPFPNDDGHGQVLVFIQENEEGADFRYSYAFVRVPMNAKEGDGTPVIWGAATPDPDGEDRGVGLTLWDFTANHEYEKAHDPAYRAIAARDQGRFAQVYGRFAEGDGDVTFNVAVFRDFKPKDSPRTDEPANLDYFFGRFVGEDKTRYDFLNWELEADLCDTGAETCFEKNTPDANPEFLELRAAFVNKRVGRAEATVSGGDLTSSVRVVECWDEAIDRTYASVSEGDQLLIEEGACAAPFEQDLADLGVPGLQDVDAEMLAKMDCVATNGVGACDD